MLTALILAATVQITVPDGVVTRLVAACTALEAQRGLAPGELTQKGCVEALLQDFIRTHAERSKLDEGQTQAETERDAVETLWPSDGIR